MERMKNRRPFADQGEPGRQGSGGMRLGADHPGYEGLWHRAERRLLLQESAGGLSADEKKRHSVAPRSCVTVVPAPAPARWTNLFSRKSATASCGPAAAWQPAQAGPQFFQDRGFVYVQTPIITGSDCEGAGEMFRVTTLDLNNLPGPKTAGGLQPRTSSARART